jgi:hypothetical protein
MIPWVILAGMQEADGIHTAPRQTAKIKNAKAQESKAKNIVQ